MWRNSPTNKTPEEVLTALVGMVPISLAYVDRSYRFIYMNEAAAKQVGVPQREVFGMTVKDVVPESWPEVKKLYDRAFAGETIRDLEIDLNETTDYISDHLGSFYPIEEDGEVIAVAAMTMNVTEIRKVERTLKTRNDLFAMLADINAAVSRSASKQELFQEVCEIVCQSETFRLAWVGEPKNGLLEPVAAAGAAEEFASLFDPEDRVVSIDPDNPRSTGPSAQAFLTGDISVINDYETAAVPEHWRVATRQFGINGGAALPIHEHGKVVAILTLYAAPRDFFIDELVETLGEITPNLSLAMDRFELERRRQATEAELMLRDRALTAATQGVVITDAQAEDNPIMYVTPAFSDLTGYSSKDAVGRNCRFLQGADTDPEEVARVRKAISAGEACEVEFINHRKDGSAFWNRLTIYPVNGPSGELTNFVGVQTDITERRILENQARQSQKMEAVGQLAGGVAHDFNNALTAIRGSVDLVRSEIPPGPAHSNLAQIDKAAELAAKLTRQLLAFSRQQVLKLEASDLNEVVNETAGMISPLIGDDIELEEQLGAGLEAVLVDRAQLQQVIMNLAINARDAMPHGGHITIRTSARVLDQSFVDSRFVPKAGSYAMIEIQDTGVGMDEEVQSKAFDPFFTTKSEGSGLGLATVYGIVNQSGGNIAVESEPNIGTTFKIYLPTTTEVVGPARTGVQASKDSLDGTETILHVEDSELLRPLVLRALGRRGYRVLSAANAEVALKLASEYAGEIDLVLTDVVMPGLNGRELAEILNAQYPGIQVLFTSGYPADILIRKGIAEVEINFIEKPFLTADLLPLIRSILDDPKPLHLPQFEPPAGPG